jgi:UDP-N-acetylmuramoyl-tripeptide--D-alanyl-D-alanine ligase
MVVTDAQTIARVTVGELVAGDASAVASAVTIDSREAVPGCAFVALAGERRDGHAFVGDALAAGARVVVVSRDDAGVRDAFSQAARRDTALVKVAEGAGALAALARYNRSRLKCPVVGVTGSTGKTTTKEFIFAALSRGREVIATAGNRNNEIGVPLTLLRADLDTGAVVVEMGMRGSGQIRDLCAVARPTLGLVTNIGATHMELLGSEERIATAKGELLECLSPSGHAFLNADDEWTPRLRGLSKAPVTTYGMREDADVRARDIATDERGRVSFTLDTPVGDARVTLGIPGRHNVYNAAAAAAVGLYLDPDLDRIVSGLEGACAPPMRMEVFETADGITVVNDAYNASPTSMRAALAALGDIQGERRLAVLGDMRELGSLADLAHFRLGELVARSDVDRLVTVGALARRIAEGARAEGMPSGNVHSVEDAAAATALVRGMAQPEDVVLVKASRVIGLEAVVEGLTST